MTSLPSLGFSPCPNDTFIFHALVHGLVECGAARFAPPLLEDVETLNRWALEGRLDVTKLSFHALGHALPDYLMLGAGAALGRGCGPLLVARVGRPAPGLAGLHVAIPGYYTTAAMLLRLFAPDCGEPVILRFDEIMPAVASGLVEAGVIIHESRFTYAEHGLVALRDLGAWWEEETGLPIPLGCIAARRSLAPALLADVDAAIRASVRHAFAHPEASRDYVKAHSQELADTVISSHIGLYVNDCSIHVGAEGMAAVRELLRRGRAAGVFPAFDGPVGLEGSRP